MDNARLNEFCKLGDQADQLLVQGRARESLKIQLQILREVETKGDLDSYLLAKVTLGVLRSYVKLGDFKNAFQVWNSTLDDGLYGIGIYALESAQTTVHDLIIYDMLCGFLHTLAESEHEEAAQAVNQYMSRVCEHALEQGDRSIFRQAINNWKQHLRSVFQTSIPHEFAQDLIRYERQLGETVKLEAIDFPSPSGWSRPDDFREMSRVVQISHGKVRTRPRPNRRAAS
jgi:hypothetical protein